MNRLAHKWSKMTIDETNAPPVTENDRGPGKLCATNIQKKDLCRIVSVVCSRRYKPASVALKSFIQTTHTLLFSLFHVKMSPKSYK